MAKKSKATGMIDGETKASKAVKKKKTNVDYLDASSDDGVDLDDLEEEDALEAR